MFVERQTRRIAKLEALVRSVYISSRSSKGRVAFRVGLVGSYFFVWLWSYISLSLVDGALGFCVRFKRPRKVAQECCRKGSFLRRVVVVLMCESSLS